MEQGEKIYVESLLSDEEFREATKLFPNTCHLQKNEFFKSEFMWRYRMGKSPLEAQSELKNKRMQELLKKVKK